MDFKQKLADYKRLIDDDIDQYARGLNKQVAGTYGANSELVAQTYIDILQRGGKRIRGALTLVGYEMCGGKNQEMIIQAARAIEMMHAYLLIIDDIQDRSDVRRGGPSAHKLLKTAVEKKGWQEDEDHTGMALALNAALLGSHNASLVLGMLDAPLELRNKALNIMNHTVNVTLHGQTNDIVNAINPDATTKDIENVLQWKTAHYTFLNPIHMGMVLAGAGCEDTNAITEYALNAGRAFQLADDLLVINPDPSKNAIDDIREGKRTLLVQYALEHTSLNDKKFLMKCLGSNNLTEAEFKLCQSILTESGAVAHVRQRLAEYIENAVVSLDEYADRWNDSSVEFLRGVANSLTDNIR